MALIIFRFYNSANGLWISNVILGHIAVFVTNGANENTYNSRSVAFKVHFVNFGAFYFEMCTLADLVYCKNLEGTTGTIQPTFSRRQKI